MIRIHLLRFHSYSIKVRRDYFTIWKTSYSKNKQNKPIKNMKGIYYEFSHWFFLESFCFNIYPVTCSYGYILVRLWAGILDYILVFNDLFRLHFLLFSPVFILASLYGPRCLFSQPIYSIQFHFGYDSILLIYLCVWYSDEPRSQAVWSICNRILLMD